MAGGMNNLNSAKGGQNLNPQQMVQESINSVSEMKAMIDQFTAGQSASAVARYADLMGHYQDFERLKTEISKKSSIERLQDEMQNYAEGSAERKRVELELAAERKRVNEVTLHALESLEKRVYQNASATKKAQIKRDSAAAQKQYLKEVTEKYQMEWAAAEGHGGKRSALTKKYRKEVSTSIAKARDERMAALKLEQSAVAKNFKNTNKDMNAVLKHPSLKNISKFTLDLAVMGGKDLKDVAKQLGDVHEKAKEEVAAREEELEALRNENLKLKAELLKVEKRLELEAAENKKLIASLENSERIRSGSKERLAQSPPRSP